MRLFACGARSRCWAWRTKARLLRTGRLPAALGGDVSTSQLDWSYEANELQLISLEALEVTSGLSRARVYRHDEVIEE